MIDYKQRTGQKRRLTLAKRTHTTSGFLEALAPHLISELRPPSDLAVFTRNPAVIGAYVEGAVRQLIARQVAPLRVATGAVIDQGNTPHDPKLPQIDTIIWAPSPAPAVFQAGDFALVPRSSAFGVLEIKSSAYDVDKLDARLSAAFIKRVTADLLADELQRFGSVAAGLGVVCVRLKTQSQKKLEKMKNASRVVVLFDQVNSDYAPRPKDIYRLVNFLAFIRLRGRLHEGEVTINLNALK